MPSVIDRHVLPFVVALATTLGASTIAAQPAFEGVLTMKMSGVGIMAGGGQRDDAGGWRTAQAIALHGVEWQEYAATVETNPRTAPTDD